MQTMFEHGEWLSAFYFKIIPLFIELHILVEKTIKNLVKADLLIGTRFYTPLYFYLLITTCVES